MSLYLGVSVETRKKSDRKTNRINSRLLNYRKGMWLNLYRLQAANIVNWEWNHNT